jgi:ribosomal protein S18 acetylase RimI-like enzyme
MLEVGNPAEFCGSFMVDLLVSYMAMTAPPAGATVPAPSGNVVVVRERPARADYLALYRAVGDAVQWDQRLRLPDAELDALLRDDSTHVYVLRCDGVASGLAEFERVGSDDVEMVNFGLVPAMQGRKLGPFLLDRALRAVWQHRPRRIWLHTDTNDHPKAVGTYERAGFSVYKRQMETFPD